MFLFFFSLRSCLADRSLVRAGWAGLYPLFHFGVSLARECASCGCSYEVSCEAEEFFVGVFADVGVDLLFGVGWVGVSRVFEGARDSDLADCLEFVCVADDVADEGVVWREDGVVVERGTCKEGFVFGAVGYVLDDFLDMVVVADVFVSEVVEGLLEGSVVVVLVVCDVVEPGCGGCVEDEVVIVAAVGEVFLYDVSCGRRHGLHVGVAM